MQIDLTVCCAWILITSGEIFALDSEDVCYKGVAEKCETTFKGPRYLFYDVNQPEGFNLRRDVYMRIAIFVQKFKEKNWILVLPPWPHLYHWQTKLIEQKQLTWSQFFNVASLNQFAPVQEMHEVFKEIEGGLLKIDSVFILQHYKDAFKKKNWKWNDKWSFSSCNSEPNYEKMKTGDEYKGWFWGHRNISAKSVRCVSFQGGATLLDDLLEHADGRYVMLDHAEVVLHDNFGDKQYWLCRRSMKFAQPLLEEANNFARIVLNVSVLTESVNKGRKDKNKGGNYLCVHLRRGDFIAGRPEEIPSIEFAAKQISEALVSQNLSTVFVATDAAHEEKMQLNRLLQSFKIVSYSPDVQSLIKYKDGGIAVIDQIICAYARHFIGSYESTFSFRIQEEREILGFSAESTFNRLCGMKPDCIQPSRWTIQL